MYPTRTHTLCCRYNPVNVATLERYVQFQVSQSNPLHRFNQAHTGCRPEPEPCIVGPRLCVAALGLCLDRVVPQLCAVVRCVGSLFSMQCESGEYDFEANLTLIKL